MSRKYNIAQFGAFDVDSFGDSLFPVAIEHELKRRIEVERVVLFSPVGSENAYNANGKIYAYTDFDRLHQEINFDVIIIGGGELFHLKQIDFDNKTEEKVEYEPGYIWQRPVKYAEKFHIPYIFWGIGVPYRFQEEEREIVKNALGKAEYVGVRDIYSLDRLVNVMGPMNHLRLQPDSLWLLNTYYKIKDLSILRKKLRMQKKSPIAEKYMVVQYGTTFQYRAVAKELKRVAEEYNWKIVLMPVNFCHEDLHALRLIKRQLGGEADLYEEVLQPEEIVALISGAEFFVGTSLHGNLVATLYGVKNLEMDMYGTFVSKLDGLMQWKNAVQDITIVPESIHGDIKQILEKSGGKTIVRTIQKTLIKEYDYLSAIIEGFSLNERLQQENTLIDVDSKCYFMFTTEKKGGVSYISYGKAENNTVCFEVELPEKTKLNDIKMYLPLNEASAVRIVDSRADDKHISCDKENFDSREEFCLRKIAVLKPLCYNLKKLSVTVEISSEDKEGIIQSFYENYNEDVTELETQVEKLKQEQQRQNAEIERERAEYKSAAETIARLQGEISNRDGHIELLLEKERELKRIKLTRTWRYGVRARKISLILLPAGSKRRLLLKMAWKFIKHPVQCMRMLSPRKIRHFFYFLREEGAASVSRRIDQSMRGIAITPMEVEANQIQEKRFEEYEKLTFPTAEEPKVSIVIPVYNQFAYTYNCLDSILKNSGENISYEIIIANDCSTDDTVRLQEVAENIRIVTNKENLRFLKNCNRAASYANGEYILFLNNDTQVQENWLEPLVQLIESKDDIGMVGSKLIYADGTLQEAGGIIWKDASAWNYGNRQNPSDPEYNYVKEVDYISGAAIMIRASLWQKIGGFDERFAPAYYEDTDLACEVRQHGYKVMYQPLSAVVHFEGISNGTDLSSGQKAYQVENQKKFYEKWKDVLAEENYENAQHVFLAKDRSSKKKTLLMVDHYVPMYDKDAGSRCMFYYLNLFVKMGYNVKFIGDNFFKHEPYTTTLQQMGIEVLYGNYYYANWKDWLRTNGEYIDYAFLSRPHISIKYIDPVREYTDAKIIYFGHDLHYLREMREYELNGNEQAYKDSKEWKKTEMELMRKADVSYYLSKVELEEIAKVDDTLHVRRVPINIYDNIPEIDYNAERRQDIIFVGGFGHPPNIDAVKWLGEEIMPKVWAKNPDITLHVVGSKPPQEIRAFDSEHMIIHGFVSDEDLEEMYRNVKLAIVPLRYGAGIKGKIIEGMMRGIPMVTTSIGIEGIEGAENIAKISDKAEELATYIAELYDNTADLEKIAKEEHQYIIDNYSVKNAVEILGKDFEF